MQNTCPAELSIPAEPAIKQRFDVERQCAAGHNTAGETATAESWNRICGELERELRDFPRIRGQGYRDV